MIVTRIISFVIALALLTPLAETSFAKNKQTVAKPAGKIFSANTKKKTRPPFTVPPGQLKKQSRPPKKQPSSTPNQASATPVSTQPQTTAVINTTNQEEIKSHLITEANIYSAPTSEYNIAVIIGNRDYTQYKNDIPDATPAENDARAFRSLAISHLGVKEENILYMENATLADMNRVFGNQTNFKASAYNWIHPDKTNLYVYYSGHGAPSPEGESYILPVDASPNSLEFDGYELGLLFANLSKLPTKTTTLILESCFSGNSVEGPIIQNASPVFSPVKPEGIPSNLNVISATSENQLASWTEDKQHGLFTYHYINAMTGAADSIDYGNQDGKVSPQEIQNYLTSKLTYQARRLYNREQVAIVSLD